MITMVQNLAAIPIPNINMADAEMEIKDFKNIPIIAMSHQTRRQLSTLLNARKYLLSEGGFYRDWRGIAVLTNQKDFFDESAISGSDPTSKILDQWHNCNPKEANFENLQNILGQIDRWDASDDIYENLVEDAKNYKLRQKNFETRSMALAATKTTITTTQHSGVPTESELDVLTVDDAELYRKNLPPQIYDAFLLYVDCDAPYAADIKRRLEENYNFKICTKDHLLAGKLFVHKALTQLIDQRCNRLIVILTKEFRKSRENDFYMNHTQAESIQNHSVKLLPLIYDDDVEIPRTLRHIVHLKSNSFNFWDRLADSISYAAITSNPTTTTTNNVPYMLNSNQLSSNNRLQNENINLPTPPMDIPSINITLVQDETDGQQPIVAASSAPIKETRYHKKHTIANGSYMNNNNYNNNNNHTNINNHYNNSTNNLNSNNNNKNENLNSKFMQVKGFVLRHAHSTSQLNGKNYKETYPSSSDISISSQCSETRKIKKKKKFSTKFLKRVFSRSNTKLQTAV